MRVCQRGLQQSAQFSDNHSNISIAPQFTTKPIYQKEPNISTPFSPIPAARTTSRSEKAQPRCGHLPGQSHDATGRGAEEKNRHSLSASLVLQLSGKTRDRRNRKPASRTHPPLLSWSKTPTTPRDHAVPPGGSSQEMCCCCRGGVGG